MQHNFANPLYTHRVGLSFSSLTTTTTNQSDILSGAPLQPQSLTSCGIRRWRPKWLQALATPAFFMLNMSVVGIVQAMTGTLVFSSIHSLERRYSFDSKVSTFILVIDNLTELMVCFDTCSIQGVPKVNECFAQKKCSIGIYYFPMETFWKDLAFVSKL